MTSSERHLLSSTPSPALISPTNVGCFSFGISSDIPESDESREGEPRFFGSSSTPAGDEPARISNVTRLSDAKVDDETTRKQTRFGPSNGSKDEGALQGKPAHSMDPSRQEGFSGPLVTSRRHSRQPSRLEGSSGPLGSSRRGRGLDDDPATTRVVHINDPERTYRGKKDISGNSVRTSKYTLLSFFPKNIFEQFQRVAYIYFLIIVILNQIPPLAVFGSTASVFPLAFVLVATALKDAYEDWGRHRSDKEENNRTSLVFQGGFYQPKKLKHIRVGEMVKIHANEIVPADIVVLSTSDSSGVAYVETMNLDGESNLKSRYAKQETARKRPEDGPIDGTLICELPNRNIYEFQAYLDMDAVHIPLGPNNILLRGCELKNTSWAIGVVVYAGRQTKAMLNNSGAQHKRSRLDRMLNRETGFLALFLLVLCCVGGIGTAVWLHNHNEELDKLPFYRKTDQFNTSYYGFVGEGVIDFLSFMILFQIMIPIALYISLELVRLWQAHFMIRDTELFDAESNSRFQCRALTINEDLGQVKYIFSDKTGTLTENKMEFKFASVSGINYDDAQDTLAVSGSLEGTTLSGVEPVVKPGNQKWKPKVGTKVDVRLLNLLQGSSNTAEYRAAHEYMLILAACNTIVPTRIRRGSNGQLEMNAAANDDGTGVIEYQGESPDEQALVSAAATYGYVLLERSFDSILIEVMGKRQRYQVLGVHEFDSVRKRMSVMIQCPDGTVKLLVKGADSNMLDVIARAGTDDSDLKEEKFRSRVLLSTMSHLDLYSGRGLRTLVIASKEIDANQFENWRHHYEKASVALNHRVGLLRETSELVEKDLVLVGATAIEDRLQEGVPETISLLREAGIKVWVLTGDKQETAVSIGYSCQLLTDEMHQIIIHEATKQGALDRINEAKRLHGIGTDPTTSTLQENAEVSSDAFATLNGSSNFGSFSSVTQQDPSAPASKKAPGQLALIIDGTSLLYALDPDVEQELYELATACKVVICCRVAPLQKAAVVNLIKSRTRDLTLAIGDGANDVSMIQMADVGIGLSGQEGRQAVMASDFAMGQFRFLKRLLLVHGHWNYQRLSYMILYNFYRNAVFVFMLFWFILYTAYSPTTSITDWSSVFYSLIYTSLPTIVVATLDKNLSHRTLYKFPNLYGAGQRGEGYNQPRFWITMVDTIWQSAVLFYIPYLSYEKSDIDLYGIGAIWTFGVVLLVNLHLAMDVSRWNWLSHVSIWGSIVVTVVCMLVLDSLPITTLLINYGSFKHILGDSRFYLDILIILPVALLPRFCLKIMMERFWPSDIQIAREFEIKGDAIYRNDRYNSTDESHNGVVELDQIPPA